MKHFIVIALTTMISLASTAQMLQPEAPMNLANIMKAMSSSLKKIAAQVKDPAQNATSVKYAEDLLAATIQSRDIIPKTAPTPDLAKKYVQMIDDSATLTKELVTALQNNDNAKAVDVLNKLNVLKKDGHTAFK